MFGGFPMALADALLERLYCIYWQRQGEVPYERHEDISNMLDWCQEIVDRLRFGDDDEED